MVDMTTAAAIDSDAVGKLPGRGTRQVFVAGIVAQAGIVVTGGLVRLTGSGLGCPTVPQCVPGSYLPVERQPQGFHKLIEFGNRSLTFVVAIVIVCCIVAAWRSRPRRPPLVVLAAIGLMGVFSQAILGAITVLTRLNPVIVAAHFLLSLPLIAAAVALAERANDAGDGPPVSLVRREVTGLGRLLAAAALVVIVLGTVVTGSGPYSGDKDHPARFGFDEAKASWLHADAVLVFVGLVVALLIAVRLTDAPAKAVRRVNVLIGVTLIQGAIGYTQYFTGLPWVLVSVHMLGATLLWIAVLRVQFALRRREVGGLPGAAQQRASTA